MIIIFLLIIFCIFILTSFYYYYNQIINEMTLMKQEKSIYTEKTEYITKIENETVNEPQIINDTIPVWNFGKGDNLIFLGEDDELNTQSIQVKDLDQDRFTFSINNQSRGKLVILGSENITFILPYNGQVVRKDSITILPKILCHFYVIKKDNYEVMLINSSNQIIYN